MSAYEGNGRSFDSATTAETLHAIAQMLDGLADALVGDDEIVGVLCSEGLANHLPALPAHVRHVLADLLTDEAARSYRADLAYLRQPAALSEGETA